MLDHIPDYLLRLTVEGLGMHWRSNQVQGYIKLNPPTQPPTRAFPAQAQTK